MSRAKYGELQAAGAKRQNWMSDNCIPCPVTKCTVNFQGFDKDEWEIEHETEVLPEELLTEPVMNALGFVSSNDAEGTKFEMTSLERTFEDEEGQDKVSCRWVGRTAPGTLFIEDVVRASNFRNPRVSEISQAVYTRRYDIGSLERIFVVDVMNDQTANFIRYELYSQSNGRSWPDPEERVWEYGTPEYQALLGTPIGKMVAAIVLVAFPRETRRIARIASWQVDMSHVPQLRFDIERV